MHVQAILEVGETNYTVIDEQVPAGDIFKTYELQVSVLNIFCFWCNQGLQK